MTNKRILFITSRNVLNTCGELRLIKSRAISLYSEWGITTDFIVLSNIDRKNKNIEEIGSNSTMRVCDFSLKNPFDFLKKYFCVRNISDIQIKEKKYDTIVLSGMFVLSYAKYFRKHFPKLKIIADIHGAFEELIEFRSESSIKNLRNKLIYELLIFEQRKYLKFCNSAFVVSKALKNYAIDKLKANNLTYFIVPCSASMNEININNAAELRIKWRNELNLSVEHILFIYSGGISPWQSINEAYNIFQFLKMKMPDQKMHFLIMSHNSKSLKSIEADDVTVRSFKPEQVKNVLFAGDFAFLLRGNFITNNVAFPNKFIEYVLSGMQIISTPHIHDVSEYIKINKLGLIVDINTNSKEFVNGIAKSIVDKKYFECNWDDRLQFIKKISFEKTLEPFYSFIQNN